LDDKIELNRRMSQTLEAIAQAIFKSWFLDFDLNWPTDGWQSRPLDSVG
jgi:restriction endonuclease S subunit